TPAGHVRGQYRVRGEPYTAQLVGPVTYPLGCLTVGAALSQPYVQHQVLADCGAVAVAAPVKPPPCRWEAVQQQGQVAGEEFVVALGMSVYLDSQNRRAVARVLCAGPYRSSRLLHRYGCVCPGEDQEQF